MGTQLCEHCKEEVVEGAIICKHCGNNTKRKKYTFEIIVGIMMLVLAITISYYIGDFFTIEHRNFNE